MEIIRNIHEASRFILDRIGLKPTLGLILGSGLGTFAEKLENQIAIPFELIPHFPKVTTEGHGGKLVIGTWDGVVVAALQGRYHFYEGISLEAVSFPVRVFKAIGIETLLLTNACGAINTAFNPGDLMVITDHLNLVGNNPLIGENLDEFGPRFPDASEIYSKDLRDLAQKVAKKEGFSLREGVYAWWTGPSYETPAEIRMIRILGGDAVGMSTVPEALTASHMGMSVLAISCLTNMATGIRENRLSHQEVLKVAQEVQSRFVKLLEGIISGLKTKN